MYRDNERNNSSSFAQYCCFSIVVVGMVSGIIIVAAVTQDNHDNPNNPGNSTNTTNATSVGIASMEESGVSTSTQISWLSGLAAGLITSGVGAGMYYLKNRWAGQNTASQEESMEAGLSNTEKNRYSAH